MSTTPEMMALELLLPAQVLKQFIIKAVERDARWTIITLEEKNTPPRTPPKHRGKQITSKGFLRVQEIQDFPLRGKPCFLRVKRRAWQIKGVSGCLTSEIKIRADGMTLTQEFAVFLKAGN